MKIAIITFHASDNCGSHLQTYALQHVLEKKYAQNVQVIDFSSPKQQEMYSIFVPVHRFRDILRNILRIVMYPVLKKEQNEFRKFWRFFHLTPKRYETSDELLELDGKYDVFVCGSDQIWNYHAGDYADAYLLDFVHKSKKVAYAVSMGQAILNDDPEHEAKYKRLLSDFSAISIREFKSKAMIQSITDLPIEICLDPTFLLDTTDYDRIMPTEPLIKGKYIFCYAFTYHKMFVENVMELSRRLGMPVYMIDRKQNIIKGAGRSGIKLTPHTGTEAFLNIFKYATLVFTTSFHGTAFSVNFKKNFWYLNETGGEGDGRATSLLRQLDLMVRYVTPTEIKLIDDLLAPIDYTMPYERLKTLREVSFSFIEENIVKQD